MTTCDECFIQAMKFPQKLWRIVTNCKTRAIQWNRNGRSILIEYKQFQEEYLSPRSSIFKTTNITSFIRQLNLYGFRKVTSHHRDLISDSFHTDLHEFLHENFCADRLDLLPKVCRKMTGKTKPLQKQKQNVIVEDLKKNDSPNKGEGMTKLQMCQIALTKALEQALSQYKQNKIDRRNEANRSCLMDEKATNEVEPQHKIDTPEELQVTKSNDTEMKTNEDAIFQVHDGYDLLIPINETTLYFHPYNFSRNL